MKYLDKTGLTYLWSKIKSKIPTKTSQLTNDSGYLTSNSNLDTNKLVEPYFKNAGTTKTSRTLFDITRANRLAFLPADQIIIEKSVDAGETWTSYGATDAQKIALFNGKNNGGIYLPAIDGKKNTNCMIRITITAMKYNVPSGTSETNKYAYWNSNNVSSTERYCSLDTMYFWVNANSDRLGLIVQRATGNNSNAWTTIFDTTNQGNNVGLSGWSGMDMITFSYGVFGGGTTQVSQSWNYRLIFRTATGNSSHLYDNDYLSTSYSTSAQSIFGIRAYGDNVWASSNELMKTDHLYTWDDDKRMNVPNGIRPNTNNAHTLGTSSYKWSNVYATTFTGDLSGNASTATKATQDASGNVITTTYATKSEIPDISGKQDTLTFDTEPTNDSTNPVTSGGLFTTFKDYLKHSTYDTTNHVYKATHNATLVALPMVDTSTNKLYMSNLPYATSITNDSTTIPKTSAVYSALSSKADTSDIPTKVSDLTNDSGYTTNTGTITGITMNGASKGTSGVVDLGTVITAHQDISGKQDKITSTNKLDYSLLSNTPTIPSAVTESTVSGWGFTKNAGTITKVQANGTDIASSGTANIPSATTSKYGVTKLSNATDSTSEVLAATPKAVKEAYDLAESAGSVASSASASAQNAYDLANGAVVSIGTMSALVGGDTLVEAVDALWEEKISPYDLITDADAIKTGRMIDGQPEYVKRINVGALPGAAGTKDIALGVTVNRLIRMEGCAFRSSDNVTFPLPFASDNSSYVAIILNSKTSLRIISAANRTNCTGWVDIYYI